MPIVPWDVLTYTLVPTVSVVIVFAAVTGWYHHARQRREDFRESARSVAPYAGFLLAVILFNATVRSDLDEISSAYSLAFTDSIYRFEGEFVAVLQDAVPEPLFLYFSAVYVIGYGALIAYPPLAYLVLEDVVVPAKLFVAYGVNYLAGAILYMVFSVFGPRNYLYGRVDAPLFEEFPDVMYITAAINHNANAFPSLHTSMSVTVLVFAWFTREAYPRWLAITALLVPSIVFATMALGIHWLTDVIAGVALALFSVGTAQWIVSRVSGEHDSDRRPLEPVRL